jgi:murein L,D-transpeptidase YafK
VRFRACLLPILYVAGASHAWSAPHSSPVASETNVSIDYALGLAEQGLDAVKNGTRPSTPTCQPGQQGWPDCLKSLTPQATRAKPLVSAGRSRLAEELREKGLEFGAPIYIRSFKQADIDWSLDMGGYRKQSGTLPEKLGKQWRGGMLEVFILNRTTGKYELFKDYNICAIPGNLGPKRNEGDMRSPEGFYEIKANAFNPVSNYHLAFNVGYPNAYDLAHRKQASGTGGSVMVHGECVTVGCLAMGNDQVEEIYALAEAAVNSNELVEPNGVIKPYSVPFHAFPFTMTDSNLSRFDGTELQSLSSSMMGSSQVPLDVESFWKNELRPAYDAFERDGVPPQISLTGKGAEMKYDVAAASKATIRKKKCP